MRLEGGEPVLENFIHASGSVDREEHTDYRDILEIELKGFMPD